MSMSHVAFALFSLLGLSIGGAQADPSRAVEPELTLYQGDFTRMSSLKSLHVEGTCYPNNSEIRLSFRDERDVDYPVMPTTTCVRYRWTYSGLDLSTVPDGHLSINVKLTAVENGGVEKTVGARFDKDTHSPVITVSSPVDGQIIMGGYFVVQGTCGTPGDPIRIMRYSTQSTGAMDIAKAVCNSDGTWSATVDMGTPKTKFIANGGLPLVIRPESGGYVTLIVNYRR